MQEKMPPGGRELADRVNDVNPLIDAVQDKFDEWEAFVPMWMNAAADWEFVGRMADVIWGMPV